MSVETTREMWRDLLRALDELAPWTDGVSIEMAGGKGVIRTAITLSVDAPPGVERRLPGEEVGRELVPVADDEPTEPGRPRGGG